MTYTNNKLYENHQSICEEYKSRIQQLEQAVTEKEDEAMFWYRQYEDAKEALTRALPNHESVDRIRKR